MIEYKVIDVLNLLNESIESRLNKLANDGWVVSCAIDNRAIVLERVTDESALLAEEVIRRQFTYSLPGMEAQDVEAA